MRMTPQAIVETAVEQGIDLIAVTDHNTAAITPHVAKLARANGLSFLYGLELQTQEDVHLLAYFDDEEACLAFSDEVYSLLPHSTHDPYGLSDQRLVDAEGRLIRVEERFLVNGLRLSFEEAVARVRAVGGFPVPAHVDRDFFSVKTGLVTGFETLARWADKSGPGSEVGKPARQTSRSGWPCPVNRRSPRESACGAICRREYEHLSPTAD